MIQSQLFSLVCGNKSVFLRQYHAITAVIKISHVTNIKFILYKFPAFTFPASGLLKCTNFLNTDFKCLSFKFSHNQSFFKNFLYFPELNIWKTIQCLWPQVDWNCKYLRNPDMFCSKRYKKDSQYFQVFYLIFWQ